MKDGAWPRLLLASASPRRKALLEEQGFSITVAPAAVEEQAPAHFTPGEIVLFNARLKANAIAQDAPDAIVIGADTVVAFRGEVLGKPANSAIAEEMLTRLNGQTHHVYSGLCLVHLKAGREFSAFEVSTVHFRKLSKRARRAYLERIQPLDKAGAYAAQDDRGELIERIEGSASNVIGLPLELFAAALRHVSEETG